MSDQTLFEHVGDLLDDSHTAWNDGSLFDPDDHDAERFRSAVVDALCLMTAGEIEYLQTSIGGPGRSTTVQVTAFTPRRVVEIGVSLQTGPDRPSINTYPRVAIRSLKVDRLRADFQGGRETVSDVSIAVVVEGRESPVILGVDEQVVAAQDRQRGRLVNLLRTLLNDLDVRAAR